MKYLSLFSGIEAVTEAWEPLGFQPVAFAEIEPFPCSYLAHRHPNVPNLGDVSLIDDEAIRKLGRIDIVVGGSPCQDLSVAGKRRGLGGKRSGLFFEQLRIFHAARHFCGARWFVWENVPGAFSSNGGRDFAVVVGEMAGCRLDVPGEGWGMEGVALGENGLAEWGVLDAQWFGVAQRRRRVFVVLDVGDWAGRPPVLLEPDSLRGDSAPRREAGEEAAGTLGASAARRGGIQDESGECGLICSNPEGSTGLPFLTRSNIGKHVNNQTPLIAFYTTQITSKQNGSNPKPDDPCHPLSASAHPPAIAGKVVAFQAYASATNSLNPSEISPTLDKGKSDGVACFDGWSVRRLTPRECERLQGYPDDATLIPYRGKPASDGPRYKALGNGMAVPVMRWIGRQLLAANNHQTNKETHEQFMPA